MTAIPVLVITKVRLYQEGLSRALGADPRFTILGTAATGNEAAALVAALPEPPAVALLDLGVPDGAPSARSLVARLYPTRIIALAVGESDAEVVHWAEAGVAALMGKEDSLVALMTAIEAVVRGEAPCSPRVGAALIRRVASAAPAPGTAAGVRQLTRREREVALLLAEGLANKQIAAELVVELSTVKNHVHNLLEKLGASSRTEAAALLREHGLDQPPRRRITGPPLAPSMDPIRIQ